MKLKTLKDIMNDLSSGSKYGVFIDDTGSPGLKDTPPNLHPDRKSWIGVIVKPNQMPEVLEQFEEAIEELQLKTGAKEFHFTDIYSGNKNFKNVDLQVRLSLFEFMAHIFKIYNFPIVVQTFDPVTLQDLRSRGGFPEKVGPFDLTKQVDAALLFLLFRIKWYLEKNREDQDVLAQIFVDEGYKKNGRAISIPVFNSFFAESSVFFVRSSLMKPIQLADFAAFALNRTQLLIGKRELTQLDKRLLEILSPIVWNYQNIKKVTLKFDSRMHII